MKNNLFVIILHYMAPLDTIDLYKKQHIKFLDYDKGIFL